MSLLRASGSNGGFSSHLPVQVPKVERQIAQQYYLKRYASWWVSSNTKAESKAAFELEHPRYSHLVEGACVEV